MSQCSDISCRQLHSLCVNSYREADSGGSRGRMGDASPTGTHNAPKLAILRSKMEKKFWGVGTVYPLPTPHPLVAESSDHIPPTNDFWIRHWRLTRTHKTDLS